MANEYVPMFFDWIEVTEELTDEEIGRLTKAIILYARGDDYHDQLIGNERILFPSFRRQIDRAQGLSAKRADAGRSGGNVKQAEANESKRKQIEANESKSKQIEANESKTAKEKEYKEEYKEEYNNDKEGDEVPPTPQKAQKRFSPPPVEEVSAYCRERGNSVAPQHFCDFYAAKGWKVGNQPMKDWRAAVRTWEQRDNMPSRASPRGKTVSAQQYAQRTYTETDLTAVSGDLIAEAKAARKGERNAGIYGSGAATG